MARTRAVAIAIGLAFVMLGFFTLFDSPLASASGPGCVDAQPAPVLQDAGWGAFNGTTTFLTQYLGESVIKWGQTFIIYAQESTNGSVGGIYRGTSLDGIKWTMSATPVLTPGPSGSWDSSVVFSPDVVWNGTGFMMYYVGDGSSSLASFRQIGVAFSPDGTHWTKYADNPVIGHGPGLYDARYTRGPSVILDNGTYKMWYTGETGTNSTKPFLSTIDYATSSDGVHWTKYAKNPVFTGFVEYGYTYALWPSVVKADGTYLMAFGDGTQYIGLATSADGVNWRFNNQTDILVTLGGWHSGVVAYPSLLLVGNSLLLWYAGQASSNLTSPYVAGIGYAACGVLVAPSTVTTTSTFTSVFVLTKSVVSTLISTSISPTFVQTTEVSTVLPSSGASFVEVATAAVLGFCGALVLTVILLALRVRSRGARKSS